MSINYKWKRELEEEQVVVVATKIVKDYEVIDEVVD